MQIGLALFIWLIVRLLGNWPSAFNALYSCAWRRKSHRNHHHIVSHFFSQPLAIAQSTVVDFHEPSCFFVLAVQAVLLFTLSHGSGTGFLSTNIAQGYANGIFAGGLGIGGLLNMTFALFTLASIGLSSRYLIALVGTVIPTTIITMHMTLPFLSLPIVNAIAQTRLLNQPYLDKCGFRPPPVVWCGDSIAVELSLATEVLPLWPSVPRFCCGISGLILLLHLTKTIEDHWDRILRLFPSLSPIGSAARKIREMRNSPLGKIGIFAPILGIDIGFLITFTRYIKSTEK